MWTKMSRQMGKEYEYKNVVSWTAFQSANDGLQFLNKHCFFLVQEIVEESKPILTLMRDVFLVRNKLPCTAHFARLTGLELGMATVVVREVS